MRFIFQRYDPVRAESELQEAKLREKDPQWDRRDWGKRIAVHIGAIILCLAALYLLTR